ncbi:sigma-54-dependent Fis family transcriptional regulator [bacterium]|nr:sigma-54-dependent Fis family transcriptional regulator [bacterium]
MVLRKVLIIDDEENILDSLKGVLEDEGFQVEIAKSGTPGIQKVRKFAPDIVLLDIWMPGDDGLHVLEKIKGINPDLPVIMMSGHGTVETAVKAIKLGAFDFLEKPIHFDKLLVMLEHAFELESLKKENKILRDTIEGEEQLIGKSAGMVHLRELISLTAPSNGWVMIRGENGTGKELVAKTLHRESLRAKERFVAVNCAAIPDELIESELFGHEKGSFTGAHERKIGKFELANGGTLFLDEVGDMGHKMQAKILRALEECVIQRVGGQDSIELDLRVVCATNKDLKKEIKLGNFREDLFYRLNVIPLTVPSLRERREDIPLLVRYFLESFSGNRKIDISSTALEALQTYPWPGNVRELKNWIERACILSSGNDLQWIGLDCDEPASESPDLASPQEKSLREARANFEKQFILKVLAENGGNVSKTAQHIGVERSHLHKKIKAYGIDISDQGGTV